MILIQAESGAIIRDPKAIYVTEDCEGKKRLAGDLSNGGTERWCPLTDGDYSEGLLVAMEYTLFEVMAGEVDMLHARVRGDVMFIRMREIIKKVEAEK